jgi:hypothetical protein
MSGADEARSGACLCGRVRFTVRGRLRDVIACHCTQCRRQSGHYWAATDARCDDVTIEGGEALAWYEASEKARRGFCTTCGSFLFWDERGTDRISIAAGAFDRPTGLRLARHIFVDDKGDYYEIADGLPQRRQ